MTATTDKIFERVHGPAIETWLVGTARVQTWVHPPEGRPFRPLVAVCLNVEEKSSLCALPTRQAVADQSILRRVLVRAVSIWKSRPARIQADQPEIAALLSEVVAGEDIPVELLSAESPALRRDLASHAREFEQEAGGPGPSSLLTGEGVTVAQIEAFARAAMEFLAAAPWRLLQTEDLVRIDAPGVAPKLRHVSVSRSAEGPELRFFEDPESLDEFLDGDLSEESWAISFPPLWKAPPADSDLWERFGLPRSGEEELIASPMLLFDEMPEETERPDTDELSFFEGLLNALAASTEAEMDGGRWDKEVATYRGRLRFSFSLPVLLQAASREEPPDVSEEGWASAGPVERVRHLLEAAEAMGGRVEILMARRALEIQPDCAEAYLVLAQRAPTPERKLELYDRARALAEQALATNEEEDNETGHEPDWEIPPEDVLRLARRQIGRALYRLGRLEEAASQNEDLLRQDPTDFFLRNDLAALWVEMGRDAEALALWDNTENDRFSAGAYMQALLTFRREGKSPEARRALRTALRMNPIVPDFLLRRERLDFSFDDRQIQAHAYASSFRHLWKATPGALTWLADSIEPAGIPRPASMPAPHPAFLPVKAKKRKSKERRKGKKRRR